MLTSIFHDVAKFCENLNGGSMRIVDLIHFGGTLEMVGGGIKYPGA